MANKQDECTGAFFEGRIKSIAILDEESLLWVCAYIDLNPVAAGIAPTPEESEHTLVKERVEHVKASGRTKDLQAAEYPGGPLTRFAVAGLIAGACGSIAMLLSFRLRPFSPANAPLTPKL